MKYFNNVKNLDELKKEYRRLVKIHHPDVGGDKATMQTINDEHDALFEILKKHHNETADEYHQTTETPEEFREIIEKLMKLDGLDIELCGSWLWIGGETRKHKDELKAMGCNWCSKKKLWSWHHKEEGHKGYRGNRSMDQIRNKYGSQTFKGGKEEYRAVAG